METKCWIACAALTLLLLGLVACAPSTPAPTPTSTPTAIPSPTPTPVPSPTPSPTPTPVGADWLHVPAPNSQGEILMPPPEVQAELREKFKVFEAAEYIQESPELLQHPESCDLQAKVEARSGVLAYPPMDLNLSTEASTIFVCKELAPKIMVQCRDYEHCTASRAHLYIEGVIVYGGDLSEVCENYAHSSPPCYIPLGDDQIDTRFNVLEAYFAKNDEGEWLVENWRRIPIPPPPDWEGGE